MKTSSEKEKKLILALSKLKNLNLENPHLANTLKNLDDHAMLTVRDYNVCATICKLAY